MYVCVRERVREREKGSERSKRGIEPFKEELWLRWWCRDCMSILEELPVVVLVVVPEY